MVLDGQFVCVDPYLGTGYHLLSDNLNSKLEVIESIFPKFKNKKKKFINKEAFPCLKISNYRKFILNGANYLPFLKNAKYVKSFLLRER